VDLALGDSEFNRQELEALGFGRTGRAAHRRQHRADHGRARRPALEKILGDGLINILFVGRIVPNKRIEDHIRLAEMYKRYVDSYYRFIFVGRYDGVPAYYHQIRALIGEYRMLPERFWFTGPVPDEDLAAFYRWADVYVSLSEHEGFCVPLVEAMAADVPVLAYAAGAVPETLGGSGVLFAPKDLEFAAELLGTLVYDRSVRDAVIAGQRRRLADFAPAQIEARLPLWWRASAGERARGWDAIDVSRERAATSEWRGGQRVSAANEPDARSGARGPREGASRGERGAKAPGTE
jgi:L-malate glycosyltransferase